MRRAATHKPDNTADDKVPRPDQRFFSDLLMETERQLFYFACTRARDRLIVSGVNPGSEFMQDMSG